MLVSLVVELLDLGQGWRPGQARLAIRFHLNPMTIVLGIVVFFASCGAFMAWIMSGVEYRARRDGGKR